MSQLIGKILYPASSAEVEVEYCRLYAEDDGNLLVFRLINRGTKTVYAYRLEVCVDEGGNQRRYSVERKNLSVGAGQWDEECRVSLPVGTDAGVMILNTVIYDNLSHSKEEISFPFASFEAVSRVAEEILSGAQVADLPHRAAQPAAAKADASEESEYSEVPCEDIAEGGSKAPMALAIAAAASAVVVFVLFRAMMWGGL